MSSDHERPPNTPRSRNTRLWTLLAVVFVAVAAAATVWVIRSSPGATPANDCAVIERLGPEWTSMQRSVAELGSGSGDTKDLIAIADKESAMSDKIRAAKSSVAAQNLKDQLDKWAQGTALTAKGQRAAANQPTPQAPTDSGDAESVQAAQLTFDATAALRNACPNLQLS